MATIEGLKAVQQKLKSMQKKYTVKDSVTVGFAQSYAIYIHEMTPKNAGKPRQKPAKGNLWGPHGQPKFLEEPARNLNNSGELTKIAKNALTSGASIQMALKMIGLRIQREAQERVPIDTGALRASGFTSETSKADEAAVAAKQKGESKRAKALSKRKKK